MSLRVWFKEHGFTKAGNVCFRFPEYDNPLWENTKDGHIFKVNEVLDGINNIRADMDILSKRITNSFEYVTTVMAMHRLAFHAKPVPKVAPKKPAKKNKRRTPEQLNSLIEMVRKA